MTWATATNSETSTDRGEAHFVDSHQRAELEAHAVGAGLLLVPIEPPRPALRGRLALLIEGAVEEQLERRGAPPPGVGASSDLDASLSDQLYRARLVGNIGLAISLHSLEGIANLAGSLDAEDSAVLRWWLAATQERPVKLLLASADRGLGVYDEPVSLCSLLDHGGRDSAPERSAAAPSPAPEVVASAQTMELSEIPPSVVETAARIVVRDERELTPSPAPTAETAENDAEALMRAMAAIFADDDVEQHTPAPDSEMTDPSLAPVDAGATTASESFDPDALESEPTSPTLEPPSVEAFVLGASDTEAAEAETAETESEPAIETATGTATKTETEAATEETAAEPATETEAETETEVAAETDANVDGAPARTRPHAPLDPAAAREWVRWARELESTRGPKPLAVVERTFVSSFVPLCDALARGIAGEEALPVTEAWSTSFARSYSEAFDALRVRGKRPTMVLDIPDLALRIGRLHGARSAQLILVDGMRFDLGVRINERLRQLLGQHAALTERLLLWSALPSTTSLQLELMGRGPQGLREITEHVESEVPVARGRAAATFRRVRAGHREVLKLDLVESAMSVPGGPLAERLDDLADETAEALANHIIKLPPRTLAMVFGDHGFVVEPMGSGTSAAKSGGASPEEVLVPAFAWLVGAVH